MNTEQKLWVLYTQKVTSPDCWWGCRSSVVQRNRVADEPHAHSSTNRMLATVADPMDSGPFNHWAWDAFLAALLEHDSVWWVKLHVLTSVIFFVIWKNGRKFIYFLNLKLDTGQSKCQTKQSISLVWSYELSNQFFFISNNYYNPFC